jgi:hypothetical protein
MTYSRTLIYNSYGQTASKEKATESLHLKVDIISRLAIDLGLNIREPTPVY